MTVLTCQCASVRATLYIVVYVLTVWHHCRGITASGTASITAVLPLVVSSGCCDVTVSGRPGASAPQCTGVRHHWQCCRSVPVLCQWCRAGRGSGTTHSVTHWNWLACGEHCREQCATVVAQAVVKQWQRSSTPWPGRPRQGALGQLGSWGPVTLPCQSQCQCQH